MTGNWYNVSRPESYTYYYYGFVTVDLNLTQTNHSGHGSCPQSDPDIAGIGVVTSFLIAGVMTTALSITAAILESMINEENGHIHLPKFLHNRIARGVTDRQRESCIFWREVLERLILNLADQQLITGFSLLIIAYIVQPSPVTEAGKLWPARLSLVIYLSCLSSSSHLACMLTLQKYLKLHPALAKLRIFFIILFAVALSISIGLGQTFSVVGYILNKILAAADSKTAYNLSLYIGNGLLYGFPPAIALHVYWTAVLQLLPDTKRHIKEVISRMYHSWGHKLVPGKMLRRILGEESAHQLRRSAKATLWWLIFFNPPMIFAMQVIYANISLVFVLLQKFGGPSPSQVCWDPAECDLYFMCKGLDNEEENKWGFGQMLAMFVLLLPFLAAVETYQGESISSSSPTPALINRTPN